MTPQTILEKAKQQRLSVIALTDHNSVENCEIIMTLAPPDILIIPGMELQTKEEIHIVCLFETIDAARHWQEYVDRFLPKIPNRQNYFGNQSLFDGPEHISGEKSNLLLVSTELAFDDVFWEIKRFNGTAIPAHIDRPSYSVLSVLGLMPTSCSHRTMELSHHCDINLFRHKNPDLTHTVFLKSSDAHRPEEIGQSKTGFVLPELSWKELTSAFIDPTRIIYN